MRKGTETFNANYYSDTPVIIDGMIAKFATSGSLSLIDNEKIELKVTDGDRFFYHTVNIDKPEHEMTELLAGFSEHYNTGRFATLVANLIKSIDYLESDLLRQQYQEAIRSLKDNLNARWKMSGKKEKETIGDILKVLNERLDTVSKFLSNKYRG